jgi:hypothetical protein
MRRLNGLFVATFILCILVILFTLLDFLCLHDIRKDYVSRFVLTYLNVEFQQELPEWTGTKGEWRIVTISYFIRVLFLAMNIIVLTLILKKYRGINQESQSERGSEI